MRLAGITRESIVDGPGVRLVVFVQGCNFACPFCHNPESWDLNGGQEFSVSHVMRLIKKAATPLCGGLGAKPLPSDGNCESNFLAEKKGSTRKKSTIRGITFSGGEPFLQAHELSKLAKQVKEFGWDIVTYTGYTYEDLKASPNEDIQSLLHFTDYLIDGLYIHELRDLNLKFRGSSNQRFIKL